MESELLISLLTLTAMEIVLGIDNIVFISILVGRLPEESREKARRIGLGVALLLRVGLLAALSWLIGLTEPLFTVFDMGFAGRDLILLGGGLFLIGKSTLEIHHKIEGDDEQRTKSKVVSFGAIIGQIAVLDLVFSLDSVITAIGLVDNLTVMVVAVVLAMIVMVVFAKSVSEFIEKHPTMKMLALSFLLMIGLLLVVESVQIHVPKGYVYFAMAFSLFVEMLNLKIRSKSSKDSK